MPLPDGVLAVVKRECPTCVVVAPVLAELAARLGPALTVYSQDDPAFPAGVAGVVDDRSLDVSWQLQLETVPSLIRVVGGAEVDRIVGWDRRRWETFTGVDGLGAGLPDYRPGCGSRTLDPGVATELMVRFRGDTLHSRRIDLSELEDDMEAMFSRGWTDGLPVVPPTEARVLAMLDGTSSPCRRDRRHRPSEHGARFRGKSRRQRGTRRMPARVPAAGAHGCRGGVQRRVQHARGPRHHLVRGAGGDRQRPPGAERWG